MKDLKQDAASRGFAFKSKFSDDKKDLTITLTSKYEVKEFSFTLTTTQEINNAYNTLKEFLKNYFTLSEIAEYKDN